ncbi:MAG: peptide/nickel transport system permease protein [Planctomycetota bacterium]
MFAFLLRRLLLMVPTTLGIALVVFSIFHLAPGDPATVMMGGGGAGNLGANSDVEGRVEKFRREHGLDRAILVQFLDYIGPFNLDRDGHTWFSTPHTERKLEVIELPEDGGSVEEGSPLYIEYLVSTAEEDAKALNAALDVLLDDADEESAWVNAAEELVGAGEIAMPALMTGLYLLQEDLPGAAARLERVSAALTASTGHTPEVHPQRESALGPMSLVRHWFGWYYQNGGYRLQNTGAKPWGGLLAFDLRKEMQTGKDVATELTKRIKVTLPLALISVLLSYLIALPLGIFSVRNMGKKRDGFVTVALFVLFAIPTFWAGLMLILVFGKTGLDLLPVLGLHDKDAADLSTFGYAWDTFKHGLLPVLTLTYGSLAYLSRQMRAGMMDVIQQDYIRTARAKGLSEDVVIYKHALRNSVIPILTLLASVLPVLIGGSIIVEMVFDIPGMGLYAYKGLLTRDFNIIMATTVLVGIMTQFGILFSDLTYSLVDPRIRHE